MTIVEWMADKVKAFLAAGCSSVSGAATRRQMRTTCVHVVPVQ